MCLYIDELNQLLDEIEDMVRDGYLVPNTCAFEFKIIVNDRTESKIRVTVHDKDPEENQRSCVKIGTIHIKVTEDEIESYLSDIPEREHAEIAA